MPRKKAVKVRKWVTCAEPGCKRRAGAGRDFCGEHEIKKRDSLRKKFDAADKKKSKRKAKPIKKVPIKLSKKAAAYKKRKDAEAKKKKKQTDKLDKAVKAARKKVDSDHAERLNVVLSKTRLVKAHCEKCDYTIRLSRKWIAVKRPICPVCMRNMATGIDNEAPDPRQLKLKGAV